MIKLDLRNSPNLLFKPDNLGLIEYGQHSAKIQLLELLEGFINTSVKLSEANKRVKVEVIWSDYDPLFLFYLQKRYDFKAFQEWLYTTYEGDSFYGPIVCDRCGNTLKNAEYIEYSERYQSIKCNHCINDLRAEVREDFMPSLTKLPAGFEELFNFDIKGNTITVDSSEMKKTTEAEVFKSPKEIYNYLDRFVMGQDTPKKLVSVAGFNHLQRIRNPNAFIEKENMLLTGSSSSGKSFLAETLAKGLGVPFCVFDMTSLSAAGYVGANIKDIIQSLFRAAKYDVEATEKGICVLDEIGKLAQPRSESSQVNKMDVQEAMLKLLEGTDIEVKDSRDNKVAINTKNILFIGASAFSGLTHKQYNKDKSIGFLESSTKSTNKPYKVTSKDIIDYGMLPELVGRLHIIANLKPLSIKIMKDILLKSENSALLQLQNQFKLDGKELVFTNSAIEAIATKVFNESELGARALKSELVNILNETMFNVLGNGVDLKVRVDYKEDTFKIRTRKLKEK